MGSHYELVVTVVSAKNLKNVNWKHGSLRPYAVLWVDPAMKCSTKVDVENDDDPIWEEKLTIPLPPHVPIEDAVLSIDVVHADAEEGVKPLIGSARLALREVVEEVGIGDRSSQTLKLKRPSGRPHGKLELSVCVRDPVHFYEANAPPPYGVPYGSGRDYGYGVPPTHSYQYGAPPPPGGYPYGAPPPVSNYGYGAPPQPGYSYQSYSATSEEGKKGKMGMGAGLAIGAVAGVVGGVALAEGIDHLEDEIAEDAAEKVEEDMGYNDDF